MRSPHKILSQVMHRHELTGTQLAHDSGLSEAQISNFKTGRKSLATESLIKLIRALPSYARVEFLEAIFDLPHLSRAYLKRPRSFTAFLLWWLNELGVSLRDLQKKALIFTSFEIEQLNELLNNRRDPTNSELLGFSVIMAQIDKKHPERYAAEKLMAIRDRSSPYMWSDLEDSDSQADLDRANSHADVSQINAAYQVDNGKGQKGKFLFP